MNLFRKALNRIKRPKCARKPIQSDGIQLNRGSLTSITAGLFPSINKYEGAGRNPSRDGGEYYSIQKKNWFFVDLIFLIWTLIRFAIRIGLPSKFALTLSNIQLLVRYIDFSWNSLKKQLKV
jgi:hypothetical protein